MDMLSCSVVRAIEIAPYDVAWTALFEALSRPLRQELGPLVHAIEHVGSTAVPGMAAKPIVDLDVILGADSDFAEAAARLERLGYAHEGNLGIPGREAFKAPPGSPSHHLYVCLPSGGEHRRHLAFRDYLRSDPAEAAAYAALKRRLAAAFPEDRVAYAEGKSAFVEAILERIALEDDVLLRRREQSQGTSRSDRDAWVGCGSRPASAG